MKILSIAYSIPSKKITNDDIINWLEEYSPNESKIMVKTYQKLVRGLFKKTGSQTRYMLDKDKNETPYKLITSAMNEALEKAGLESRDIDLLIFCGVGKGFKEPANAYFYAKSMEMGCSCFDISDACMSWTRAVDISYNFLKTEEYKNIMIINGEFNAYDHGFPELLHVKDLKQISYTFPTYTIGESATATVLTASDDEWLFKYKSVPKLCDLCTIPLKGYEGYVEKNRKHNLNGMFKFVSYGRELFENAEKYLGPLLKGAIKNLDDPEIYFPHAASKYDYIIAGKKIGLKEEKIFTKVFPAYGNLVSASIPVGITLAWEDGILKRGHKVVLMPASAGMSFCVVQFTF